MNTESKRNKTINLKHDYLHRQIPNFKINIHFMSDFHRNFKLKLNPLNEYINTQTHYVLCALKIQKYCVLIMYCIVIILI